MMGSSGFEVNIVKNLNEGAKNQWFMFSLTTPGPSFPGSIRRQGGEILAFFPMKTNLWLPSFARESVAGRRGRGWLIC
jgi:hypothetical protein